MIPYNRGKSYLILKHPTLDKSLLKLKKITGTSGLQKLDTRKRILDKNMAYIYFNTHPSSSPNIMRKLTKMMLKHQLLWVCKNVRITAFIFTCELRNK